MRTPEDDGSGIIDITSEALARPPAPPPVKRAASAFGFTGASPVQRVNDMPAPAAPGGLTREREAAVLKRVAAQDAAAKDDQRRAESSAREADFRTRGVKHYVDAFGNLQPVRDEQGREVFTEADLDPAKDEKTGSWYRQRRTSTGEIQRTPAPLRPSADENDPNLYYDLGNDRRERAGHADDILARVDERTVAANPALADWRKTALKAKEDREKAVRKAALAPLEESQRAVEEKAAAATLRASDLATQAEDLTRQLSEIDANPAIKARSGGVLGIGASPTPEAERLQRQRADLQAKLEALQSERTTIETDLKEGPTAQAKARTKTELDLAKAQAEGVDIDGAIERRRAFLKSAGRPEDGDTYLRTLTAEAEKRGVFASESRKRLREAEKQDREIEANAAALAKDAAKGAQVKTNVHGRDIVANPVTEEERATLAQEFDALKSEADALDTSNPETVAAFNARVESANKLRDQLNASAAFGNARAEQEKAAAARADLVDRNATRLAELIEEDERANKANIDPLPSRGELSDAMSGRAFANEQRSKQQRSAKAEEFIGRFTKEADRNAVRSAALAIRDDRTAAKVDWAKGLGYRTDHRGRFQINPDSLLPDFKRATQEREDGKAPAPSAKEAIEGAVAEKLITREQADDILGRVTANQRQIEAYAVNRTVTNRDFMAWYEANVAPQLAEPIKRDASGKIIPTPSIQQAALAWLADPKNGSAVNDFVQRGYDSMVSTLPIYPVLAVAGRVGGSERLENYANDTLAFIEGRGDVRRDENFASSLASGVGSVVGFVSTGAVTGAAARGVAARSVVGLRAAGAPKFAAQLAAQLKHAPIFVAAGSQSAAATMRQLDEAGVARDDQWIPMLVSGGVTALTETAPMFRTIETYLDALGGKVKGEFGKRMTTYLATAAKEGVLQELPQQIADNAISLGYNPQVSGEDWVGKLFEGAGEAVAVGGIVGAGGTAVPTEVRNAVVGLVNAYRGNQTSAANRERVASVRAAREGMAPSVQAITSGDFEGIARRWNFNHAQEHGGLEITPAQAKAASELVTGTDEAMRAARAGVRAGADAGSTEALFAEAAAADAEAKHLATYSAALYVQPELDAIPDDAPMVDQATGQPMPQTQTERTRSRDAATALSRIALGVRPEALTAQQATALAGLAEQLGVPAVTPINDIPVVTDAARQWLGERSPTAASLLRPEAEMRAEQAANDSQGRMEEGQAATTEPAPATPAPTNPVSAPAASAEAPNATPDNRGTETPTPAGAEAPSSAAPATATVSFTDEQGNRRTRPIPAGATTSDGKPVRNVTTARQWIAENAGGRVADVQFTPAPKAKAPAPAATPSPDELQNQEKARQGQDEGQVSPSVSTPPPAAASNEAQPEGVSSSTRKARTKLKAGQATAPQEADAGAQPSAPASPEPDALPSQPAEQAQAWVDEQFAAGYTRVRKLKGRFVLQNRAAGKAVAFPSREALELARTRGAQNEQIAENQGETAPNLSKPSEPLKENSPALSKPILARGQNTPARFVSEIFRAAELAGNTKARPAMIELAQRLSKANPAEFANMEVRAYSEEEWSGDPSTSAFTPDSSLAYNPETNTLYLRRARIKGDLNTLVSGIVHESGHFAERFAADSKAIADAWAALTDAEIVAAARDYSPDDTRSAAEIRADNRSRSEWFAQQFARVVTGRAASVPESIRLKLASFFRAMKAWAVKYLGTDAARSDALDREILRVMGFNEEAKPVEPEVATPTVVEQPTPEPRATPETTPAGAEQTPRVVEQTQGVVSPTAAPSKVDALADKLFDGLLGTPAERIEQRGFPRDRRQTAIDLAEAMIESGIRTPEGMAAYLDGKFARKARPFSQSLWSMFAFADPSLASVPDWDAVYARLDAPAAQEQTPAQDEPTPGQQGDERAGGNEPASPPVADGNERPARMGDEQPVAGQGVAGGREPTPEAQGGGDQGARSGDQGAGGRGDSPRVDGDVGTLRRPGAQPEPVADTPAFANYRITPADRIGEGGLAAKARDNLAAIRTLKKILAEDRFATPAEKAILVRYVGWGGLKSRFDPKSKDYSAELADLLTPEEYAAARRSVQDAHYTSPTVITRGIYPAMLRFGFRGGKMVEGGLGIGHFIGMMPDAIRAGSSYLGIERDTITAQIAQKLYPEAKIHNVGLQDAPLARDSFDASVGNPPFGEQRLSDKAFRDEARYSIHNYFIAKQLALLRPGGVAGYVVSHYFLDAKDPSARQFIAESAQFLGAIRLPNTAFKQNANTEVTTDIVFFRKLAPGEQAQANADWVNVGTLPEPGTGKPMSVNSWFVGRPEMMLGKLTLQGSMYAGRDELTLEPTSKDQDLGADLDAAVARLPENVYSHVAPDITDRLSTPEPVAQPPAAEGVPAGVRVGAFYITSDGTLMRRAQDVNLEKQAEAVAGIKEADEARIKGMVRVRDALNALVRAEFNTESTEAELDALRATLNRTYDAFVKQHGLLNRPVNRRAFFSDPEAFRILGLETDYDAGISSAVAKKQGGTAREPSAKKAAIFAKRVNQPYREVTSVGTAKEALAVALNQRGEVDLAYMTELSGLPEADLIRDLDGLIFRTPNGGFQSREQYLSGNVRQKLKQAEAAMEREGDTWRPNVEALRAVIPADIPAVDIAVPAGAGWVPAEDVRQFARELTGATPEVVIYRKSDGGWLFTMEQSTPATRETWGVSLDGRVVDFSRLFADILNVKPTIIYDKTDDDKQVVNEKLTALAAAKSEEIKAKWADWIWQDADRRERLARIYNDNFNNYVDPRYDGSHLTLPGASPLVKLRQHQLNVIWRTITERRALYDHVVGAGKTFAGIGAFMEMRRMGRVRKPLFVVPNHLTKQWADEFVKLYPNANVLYTSPKDFDKDNRQTLFAKILTGEYDAVIIGHSQFKKIGVSREIEKGILQEMIDEITESIEAMKAAEGKRRSRVVAQAEKTRDKITEKLKALADDTGARDSVATFEELGIDGLFVDEAHEFKNLFYTTQMQRVAGLGSPAGSGKAFDLYLKTRYMHTRFGGKAPLVFATGTPISNSLVEMFTMQRYLQPDTLADMGLKTLDAWVKVFGDVKQVYEVDPTGTGYRMATRLAQFQNVGEIASIYRTVADVITMGDLMAQSEARGERFPVPKLAGGKPNNYVADRTPDQAAYFGIETQVVDSAGRPVFEADGSPKVEYPKGTLLYRVDNLPDDPKEDNMLKITNDARKAGLDMRLVDPSYPDRPESKVNRAVSEIVALHKKWEADRGTQLVFCDLSVPASARGEATKKAKEKLSEFYFTQQDGQIVPLEDAKPVALKASPEGLEWFVAKSPKTGNWRVYERSSGLAMRGSEKTRTAAISAAEQNLAGFDPATLKSNIEKGRPAPEQLAEARNLWLDAQEAAEAADQAAGDGEDAAGAEEGDTSAISMDELLADGSKHSVYDDMKAKLVAAGIPEKEIAFIHDYQTPLAKQKLFDQMNRGEVRVLFGSTPKLGAGTNVQKRLVALHHLDAPWRPSDLEQREGRIIRQGNELYQRDPDGFEVVVNRYATKQTYDTRMWQLLEHKARGVEGFRKADRSTRRLEDVAGEAANASDMKAAASGDPMIQREIELRNERSKLELLKRAYQSNRFQHEDRAKWLRAAPERRDAAMAVLQEKIAARQPVPEDPWTFTKADGTVHEDKKGMAEVLADAIKRAADAANGNAPVGVYRGFEINVRRQQWKGDILVEVMARPADTESARDKVTDYTKDDTISDTGLVQRLDNYLAGFEAKVEEEGIQAQRSAETLTRLEAELAKPFAREADLQRVRQEHDQVKTQLLQKKGGASRPAQSGDTPPATMGTPAETEASRLFNDLLQELPDRARDIVRSRLGGETFESIGGRYGFDARRAESLFRSALGLTRARLRKRMGDRGDDAAGGTPARISPIPGTGGGGTLGTPRERQTDTPEFRRWFGDSKVVDAQGKPLVVYHGTSADIPQFDPTLGSTPGSWFAASPDGAAQFGDRIVPVFLSIQNPGTLADFAKARRAAAQRFDPMEQPREFNAATLDELRKAGFDGVKSDNSAGAGGKSVWVAIDPTQIKSAIGNSGAFNPADPSILGAPSEPTPSDDAAIREHLDALRTESGLDAAKLEADYQKAITEQVGERTVGDPRLANPSATDATRAVTSSVDEQRRNEMERESHDLWQAEAERQIAANFPAVVRDLLERVRGGLDIAANPVSVKAAQIAVERLSREAVTSGDPQKLRDAQTLAYAYRVQGSEQARALAARRDPFRTPQQRMAEFFAGILFTPPVADRRAIAKAWTPREKARRIEELTQQLDGTRRLLAERERILAEREAQAQEPAATSPVAPATPNVAPTPANPASDVNVRRLRARIAEIEGELDRVRRRLNREEKLHDINAKRLQKINRVLSKMGVTVADLFAGDVVMRLKGERIVQNVANERDWDDTKKRLAKLAAQGWDKASTLKKLKLSEADARRVYDDLRRDVAARLAALGSAALDAGNLESVVGPNDPGTLGTPAEPGMGDEIDPEKAKKIEDMLAAMGLPEWGELDSPVRKARVENAERKRAEARRERAKRPREPRPAPEPTVPGETVTPAPDKEAWVDDPDALPPAIDPTNPADATRVVREAQTADSTGWDMAHEYWINSILSGPLTQAANVTGNTLNIAWTLGLKRALEATVNDLILRRTDLPHLAEYGHMLRAFVPAISRAWGNAVFAFSTEQSYFSRDILETPLALANDGFDDRDSRAPSISGTKGRIIRIPVRLLGAVDDFTKTMTASMEAAVHAYRIAKTEGMDGEAMEKRMAGLINTPGSAAWIAAYESAQRMAFQEEHGGDTVVGKIELAARVARRTPGVRYLVPFVKTPLNIFTQGIRQSPFGSLALLARYAGAIREKQRSGTAIAESFPVDEQLGRIVEQAIAFTLAGMLYGAAAGDDDDEEKDLLITGALPETTTGLRALAQRAAITPYTIRVGDYQLRYNRIEPLATILGATVDMLTAAKRARNEDRSPVLGALSAITTSITAQAENKTMLAGVEDLMEAVKQTRQQQDIGAGAKEWAASFLSSWIPNILRQPLRMADPVVRQRNATSFGEQVAEAVVPQLNAPMVDVLGREVEKGGNVLARLTIPAEMRGRPELERVDRALLNWNQTRDDPEERWAPAPLPGRIKIEGRWRPMTDDERNRYATRAGQLAANMLRGAALNVERPSQGDIDRIKRAFTTARQIARREVFGGTSAEE